MRKSLLDSLAAAAVLAVGLTCGGNVSAAPVAPGSTDGATPSWSFTLPHHRAPLDPARLLRQGTPSELDRMLASMRFPGMTEIAPGMTAKGLESGAPDHKLDATSSFGYLDGPDGTTWFYSTELTAEVVEYPNYTDRVITGYKFTVYDSKLKRVGSISDKVKLRGDEIKIASLGIDATVTQKFFNSQSNYEVMVALFFNHADYSVTYRTQVYSLDAPADAEGNTPVIAEFDGMPVDAANMAADKWSEDFFITFRSEFQPDPDDFDLDDYAGFLQAHTITLSTYKKGGWSGAPQKVMEHTIPQTQLPGDQMNSPYFMTTTLGGKPTFMVWQYSKPFFVNAATDNPEMTPDNTLDIMTYQMPSVSAAEATLTGTTSVATTPHTSSGYLYTFYSLGLVGYTDDVLTSSFGGTQTAPSFLITTEDYAISNDDSYVYSLYVHDSEGSLVKTIIENGDGFVSLTTPEGADRQVAVITVDEFGYTFHIMDLTTGEEVTSFGQLVDRESLTANIDRVRVKGKDFYVSESGNADAVGDQIFTKAIWLNTDGRVDHVDIIPLGTDVALAKVNIDSAILSPYIFDTDDEVEYMVLVKRYTGSGTATREELIISGPDNGVLLTVVPDETLGALAGISVINADSNPQLMVAYVDANYVYTPVFYDLPLARFAGGDGSAANPYQVASMADLQQIQSNPNSHYTLLKDIDAEGFTFKPVELFGGVLDGAGHTIENLTLNGNITYAGIFSGTSISAEVRDLTFINAAMRLGSSTDQAGLIAGTGRGLKLSDVHVYGLTVSDEDGSRADATVGGLVGEANSIASLSQCHVTGGHIDLPAATGVGGLIGRGRTGVSVKASAFTGSINASSEVGGIAGSLETGDETVADCHVDADLTAANKVGGIVGSSKRSTLTRNYAEGTITATTPGRWDKALAAGGIVGYMTTEYTEDARDLVKVSHNVVAVTAINVPGDAGEPEYEGQTNTVHRVAGRTGLNEAPEIVDYDDDYNPIYSSESQAYEGGLQHNYVVDHLAAVEELHAIHNGADGASIDRYDINADFLGEHGFMYGTDEANPWNVATDYDPALHFESSIIINPGDIRAVEGANFFVNVHLHGRRQLDESELFDDFLCDYDESHIAMTGAYEYDGRTMAIEFTCLKPGVSRLKVSMLGSTAEATVTGVSGIESVTAPASTLISYDGNEVSAPGCALTLYSLGGFENLRGSGSVSVRGLASGVYVVVAVSADGTRSHLKIAVK